MMNNVKSNEDFFKLAKDVYGTTSLSEDQLTNIKKMLEKDINNSDRLSEKFRAFNEKDDMSTETKDDLIYVPEKEENYVPWGNYFKVKQIIESNQFFPVWISGEAGNGKTQMVQQACADLGREFIRLNLTVDTEETDLLGGFRLVNGNTEFVEGAVVKAMRRGAVLLLDEVDLASTGKIMCLQSIMEGKGVLIKANNTYIEPKEGFTIFATSNTRGRGNDDGRYMGTNIMNGAFLDRFNGLLHQEYPPKDVERVILNGYATSMIAKAAKGDLDGAKQKLKKVTTQIEVMLNWAESTRQDGVEVENIISTRSLINMLKSYIVFDCIKTSLSMVCARYGDTEEQTLLSMYQKFSDEDLELEIEEVIPDENPDDLKL